MNTGEFVWGCFPFSTSGYDLQALSSGLPRDEINQALGLIGPRERQQIVALARDLPEAYVFGVFALSLRSGASVVGWVFATGQDMHGRKGIYAIHGHYSDGTQFLAPYQILERVLAKGQLRARWAPEDLKHLAAGKSKRIDGRAIADEEDAGCQRSASWCAALSDNWPMTGSGTQHSAGGLVLNGDFVSLQHPKDARSNMVAKPTSRHKRKRVAAIVATACAVACMGGCALYMSIRQEPEPPAPPPRESQPSSTTWAVEPNKVVAWCADSWGCRTHADEQLPAPRMKRVLDDVLKTMPDAADQAVVDAWVSSRPVGEAADAAAVAAFVKRLRDGFVAAAAINPPENPMSQSETDEYFGKVGRALLGRDLPESRSHDLLFSVQKELADSARYVALAPLQRGIAEDSSLTPRQKKELLDAIRAYRAAVSLVSGE